MNKRKPNLVGLTGGIGSGKSTVARIFEWFDIPVYYSDDRAKRIINNDALVQSEIKSLLGPKAYDKYGAYNRKHVASVVFKEKQKLAALNAIVHPRVAKDFEIWKNQHLNAAYLIKEAAILIESKAHLEMDFLIVVRAKQEIRIERVMKRDLVSKKEVLNRIKNQLSEQKRIALADFVIENNGTFGLVEKVAIINKQLAFEKKKGEK